MLVENNAKSFNNAFVFENKETKKVYNENGIYVLANKISKKTNNPPALFNIRLTFQIALYSMKYSLLEIYYAPLF